MSLSGLGYLSVETRIAMEYKTAALMETLPLLGAFANRSKSSS